MNVYRFKSLFGLGRPLALGVSLLAMQAVVPTVLQSVGVPMTVGVAHAQAADKAADKPRKKTKRTQAMSAKVYEKVLEAQELVEIKDYDSALALLGELGQGRKPLNQAEQANVYNTYAFIYYSLEQYPKAIEAYRNIINIVDGPEGQQIQARYSIAQLYFVTDKWREGVDALNDWMSVSTVIGASAYNLLSQGYYQLKDYDSALKNVEIAISMFKADGKVPKENWYGLQRFLYYEKNDYAKVVEILGEMLVHYPKKSHWVQLSAMYSELKNEGRQLAAMETAYVQGLLTKEKELINMAYLFLASDIPHKAAQVLDKGVESEIIDPTSKNLELLGGAWRQSQEIKKAVPIMAKAAASSDKGELWYRLCSVYLDSDQFKKAVDSCNKGIKKGGLKRADSANLVLGMAHFNLQQYKSARSAFNKASKDKRSKKYATQWIKHMNNTIKRQKSLEEDV
ncbi:MAG: tetratricopeptide (TPR) repeat protein [Paraglaciecola psychrophila]|jgi:tetratricopeptide (TPR) repeat protein